MAARHRYKVEMIDRRSIDDLGAHLNDRQPQPIVIWEVDGEPILDPGPDDFAYWHLCQIVSLSEDKLLLVWELDSF